MRLPEPNRKHDDNKPPYDPTNRHDELREGLKKAATTVGKEALWFVAAYVAREGYYAAKRWYNRRGGGGNSNSDEGDLERKIE